MYDTSHIRNFCIIAHIDHGKSTLADRLLELTGTVPARKMHSQFLDQMDIERERGITIKMQPVRMIYFVNHAPIFNSQFSISNENLLKIKNLKIENSNSEYILNLIDTPGHIDFTYEVSRALLAVEGAILLVDATQGVQAQTITNLELAKRFHLAVVPVMNKIDLPDARIEETKAEIVALLSFDPHDILFFSSKKKQKTAGRNDVEHLVVVSNNNDLGINAFLFSKQFFKKYIITLFPHPFFYKKKNKN